MRMLSGERRLVLWTTPPLVPFVVGFGQTFLRIPIPTSTRVVVAILIVVFMLLVGLHIAYSFRRIAPLITDDEWRASWRLNLIGSFSASIGVGAILMTPFLTPRTPPVFVVMGVVPICLIVAGVMVRLINLRWARLTLP